MTRFARIGGATGTPSPGVREMVVSGVTMQPGEILVPTLLGDELSGQLSCAAAPLVAGSLHRRAQPLRIAPVPRYAGPQADGEVVLYLATCLQQDGSSTAIAAAAALGDRVSAAFALAAVEEWAAVAGSRVVLASGSPWCSGALRAAETCRAAAAEHAGRGQTVRLLGPLSLSLPPETAAELDMLGAVQITSLADAAEGDIVVFPAHGVTTQVRTEAAERGLITIDATCPLVARAQDVAGRLADRGQHVVMIGQQSAAAAAPIASRASGQVTIVENTGGTATLDVSDAHRISYMLQPGLPVEAGSSVIGALRSRYPAARGTAPAGLCYAPSDRLATVRAVAVGSDFVLVLGDPEASDTRQLVAQARAAGARVQPLGTVFDVSPAMIEQVTTIGLIESTSAPAGLAAQVIAAIGGLGQLTVARRQVRTELPSTDQAQDGRGGKHGLAAPANARRQPPALTKTGLTGTGMTSRVR
jgi:4-hydroxy-3-methylbut-2-en-1-yl diphosphate reductase